MQSSFRLFGERVSLQNVFLNYFRVVHHQIVKRYFRGFLISIGLYLQFTYYFALFCVIVFLRFFLVWVAFSLSRCLVVQNVLHKVNGIFRALKKLIYWWCNHIRFSRCNDYRTLICASTNWPSRRTFWPKGQFFPIFFEFSEKNTLLSSTKKKTDLQG